ncbi:MAG: peptide chain release factor family protein [Planctomyces sp.]|jgi:hypothetical protein|nr:peptide chain release factor-like protein [Planctomyces sp.]GDX91761.1 hypothetical protein LBMAG46_17680 [Planctomycetia bacterium]HBC61328.1 peptide chain release factor-like protein [Planctomycetaceae bacterium]
MNSPLPIPYHHPSCLPPEQLLADCLLRTSRHSGPGGQHRNKVETAVELIHQPTGISGFAAETRSQDTNRQTALFRLRLLLAVQLRTTAAAEVQPSELWQRRCQKQRIVCNERHPDFPALLAEALNAIDAKEYDVRRAAAALGCSTSQLVRFVARVPDALLMVNAARQKQGLGRLLP